jgi:hypothetical protein
MHSTIAILLVLLAGAWNIPAAAQTAQPPAATARTVIAATKLPSVVDEPLKFRALSVTLAPPAPLAIPGGLQRSAERPLSHRTMKLGYFATPNALSVRC